MKDTTRKIWIVVADGGHARILVNVTKGGGLAPIVDGRFDEPHPPSREIASDANPRVQQSSVRGSHAVEPKTDAHEKMEQQFLLRLAGHLDQRLKAREFEGLILVAPATAMGFLRKNISPALAKVVVADVVHDYTHQDDRVVYERIKDKLPL